jgi:hypothetical protein
MTCKPFEGWIKDAASDSLDPNRQAKLNAHLSGCAECRQSFAEEQRLLGAIDRALKECFDRAPSPDFAGRVRIRLREEGQVSRSRAKLISGFWFPAGAVGISLLVFLLTISSLNRLASSKRSASTLSRATAAAIPTLNKGPKRKYQGPIEAVRTQNQRPPRSATQVNNREATVREEKALDTQVLVHGGQWATIVRLSLVAQSGPVFRGRPPVETARLQQPAEIKGIEIKPVTVEAVKIEPVVVQEVVIDTDF